MKDIVNNRKVLIIVAIALLVGIFIGWLITPSARHADEEEAHDHANEAGEVYTCSMHPQIRQSEPGKCPICGMDLIPVSSNRSSTANLMVHEMTPEAVALANINTSRVAGVSPEGQLHLTGKIQPNEKNLASVTAKFPGRIEKLFINFTGQVVRSGERLATIYSPELVTAQKELLEATKTKGTFPELYDAAREKLRLWKLSEKQINEIETLGKVRDKFDVYAERSGVLIQRNIAEGDYVDTGTILFNIVDLSSVWVMLDAYESDLNFIRTGDPVNFTVAGLPGKTFNAKVGFIDPVVDPATRAVSVRAEIPNPGMELKPGMFVTARVKSSTRAGQSLSVPRTAVLWSGKRSVVYVKVPNAEFPSFEMRQVTLGNRMGDVWLIESGLEPGEEIVTNGVFAVDAAAQLSGNYSMLMRPANKTLNVPDEFRAQVTAVADAYFKVKNALVNGDVEAAKKGAADLRQSLGRVDMKELKGNAHEQWMAVEQALKKNGDMIDQAENLEGQRKHFSMLSSNVVEMTELFGLNKDKVYKDFCPMAFDNAGAYWLSESEEIRNPYFGDSMLTCGEVKQVYRKGQPVAETSAAELPKAGSTHQH